MLAGVAAAADVRFRISIGSGGFYDHHGGYWVGQPYHYPVYHDGYYRWLDRDRYRWLDRDRYQWRMGVGPSYYYHLRPHYSSGVSVLIEDCRPMVIGAPVVIKAPKKSAKTGGVEEQTCWAYRNVFNKGQDELFAELRTKKAGLVASLKAGAKPERLKAIRESAGFCFDREVRAAMEEILLSDSDGELRREVAAAFGRSSNKDVLVALERARAGDADKSVRAEAYRSIILIKGY